MSERGIVKELVGALRGLTMHMTGASRVRQARTVVDITAGHLAFSRWRTELDSKRLEEEEVVVVMVGCG